MTNTRGKILKNKIKSFLSLILILSLSSCNSFNLLPQANAFSFSSINNWINNDNSGEPINKEKIEILSITEISDMRVRDIKRRLARKHGYGSDELQRMIDKKELINALSYEEHKVWQKEEERKKRVIFRRSIVVALLCIIFVTFRPLFVHAWEVAHVNFVVYTDKKKYELSRCREFQSIKGIFGLLLIFIVDMLQLWLTISVILSWVIAKSKYFFPVPNIPIRPAALLAAGMGQSASSAGPLANYGLNVGPMFITWLLRFLNGRIENQLGHILANAYKRRKNELKAAKREKERQKEKEERKAARRARRAEREARRKAAEEEQVSETCVDSSQKIPDDLNRDVHHQDSAMSSNSVDNGDNTTSADYGMDALD